MKLTKGESIAWTIWHRLPPLAQWALLAIGRRPETVTLGDLRSIGAAMVGHT